MNAKNESMQTICQSCAMPMTDNKLRGTEKDGSLNKEFCAYCYANGQFTVPNMTIDEMKVMLTKIMKEQNMHDDVIKMTLQSLPQLNRWKH
jgi:uncharacterized membrane protein